MRVLCFDPSGNFKEGSGTTGVAVFSDGKLESFTDIKATHYDTIEQYWNAHYQIIKHNNPGIIVCESFRLFEHKAKEQSWSAMETCQLIGYLRMKAWENGIKWFEQDPSVKPRVADRILERMGVIQKNGSRYTCMGKLTNLHIRDAVRHGVFFHRFNLKKVIHDE